MNPEQLLVDHQDFLQRVTRCAAQRKGLNAQEAQDFTQTVNLKLVKDDYRVLRSFKGKAKLTSYLTVVVQRSLLDYLDHLWGKSRPSKAAQRMGGLAIKLERLTVRDGLTLHEAIQTLITNDKVEATEAELERIAGNLPTRLKRRIESDDQLESIASNDDSAEDLVEQNEWSAAGERIRSAMDEILAELPAEESLIVKLTGRMGVAEISRTLHLEQKPLYRRHSQLLDSVREKLEARGIERRFVLEYLRSVKDP